METTYSPTDGDDGLDEEQFVILDSEGTATLPDPVEKLSGQNDTNYRGKQTKSRTGKNCTGWA